MSDFVRCACTGRMVPRTNSFGGVYLECNSCWNVEAVRRKSPADVAVRIEIPPAIGKFQYAIPPEEGLRLLQMEHDRLGRCPTSRELGANGSPCPSHDWYSKHFGGLAAACALIGIKPNRMPTNKGAKQRRAA